MIYCYTFFSLKPVCFILLEERKKLQTFFVSDLDMLYGERLFYELG